MSTQTAPNSATATFKALKNAGFSRAYVERLLPEWWDNDLLKTSAGAVQFALILQQRLGLKLRFDESGYLFVGRTSTERRFKHRADTSEDELSVSASLGWALAKLATFGIRKEFTPLPPTSLEIRESLLAHSKESLVNLDSLLDLCWKHGIPVIYLNNVPKNKKKMTGMAILSNNRPAIVLGYKNNQCAKQLFALAHEIGHIVCGHLKNDSILLDEDLKEIEETLAEQPPQDAEENEADNFALELLRGSTESPIKGLGRQKSAATLSFAALEIGNQLRIDPGHILMSYAREHQDWAKASLALNFYPNSMEALKKIKASFKNNFESNSLSEENMEYLFQAQDL